MTPFKRTSSKENDIAIQSTSKIESAKSFREEIFYGALTSFLFGFIVSLLFSVGASTGLDPIEKLERASVDFGVRMASAIHDISRENVPLPTGANPIVLVDINRDTCIALASKSRCDFDKIGQPEVMVAIDNTLKNLERTKVAAAPITVIDFLISPDAALAFDNDAPSKFVAMDVRAVEIKSSHQTNAEDSRHLAFDLAQWLCQVNASFRTLR